jgi:hypothetical protein
VDGGPASGGSMSSPSLEDPPLEQNAGADEAVAEPAEGVAQGRGDRGLWTLAVIIVLVAAVAWAWTGQSQRSAERPDGAALATRATRLSDDTVQWWSQRVRADGRVPDPTLGARGDYGTVMLMSALLHRAVAAHDQAGAAAALRALAVQAADPSLGAFELLAFSEVRAWADRRLGSDPSGAALWERYRPAIDQLLATRSTLSDNPGIRSCFADPRCYGNQKLVGAAALAALLRSGVEPAGHQSLLAYPRDRYADIGVVLDLVGPSAGDDVRRAGRGDLGLGGVLSDPPRNPTAYHALSVVMLGRLIGQLADSGLQVQPAVTAGFDRAARALLTLTAPDGDLAYFGRGQGQVWVPALVADAAAQVAARAPTAQVRGAALAVAAAALARLEHRYVGPAGALTLLPDARMIPPVPPGRSTDHYASLRTYDGLAVWALDDAATVLRGIDAKASVVPSAGEGVVVAPESNGVLTITSGHHWMAAATRSGRGDDSRYGPGLLALRSFGGSGRSRSLIPERPFLPEALPTVALEDGPREWLPDGKAEADSSRPGSALVRGTWRAGLVEELLLQRWTLRADGAVVIRWRMTAAHTVVVRAVATRSTSVGRTPGGALVTDPGGRKAAWSVLVDGRPAAVQYSTRGGGGSAYAGPLRIVALRAPVAAGSVVEVTIKPG